MRTYIPVHERKKLRPGLRLKHLEHRNQKLKDIIGTMKRLLEATGFVVRARNDAAHSTFWHPALKECGRCGHYPAIVEDIYERGKFMIQCHCAARTQSFKKIKDAITAWNRNDLTPLSVLTSKPLTKETMDTDGARRLVTAIGKLAAADYRASVRKNKPDKFIADFLEGIYSGGRPVIETLEEEALESEREEVEVDEEA